MKKYLCMICLLATGCSTGTHLGRFNPNMSRFRQMENAIGCISTYNYNRLNSLYTPLPILLPIPQTQQEYQIYKKIRGKIIWQ